MFKAVILDFDGTLTQTDVLDYLTEVVGKRKQSEFWREKYYYGHIDGITCLSKRIELLNGMKIADIYNILGEHLLRPGYDILNKLIKKYEIIVVLISGNICPVVSYYKDIFLAKEIFCTEPNIINGKIDGVEIENIGKKVEHVDIFFSKLNISKEKIIAVGDDLSDIQFFKYAGKSISFNWKS